MYKVQVRLLSSLFAFDRPYTYLSRTELKEGNVVALPFGKSSRHQYGIVVKVLEDSEEENTENLKSILFSLPDTYSLTPLQMGLAQFMSEHFFTTFGDSARLMLPTGLDIETAEFVTKGDNFSVIEKGTDEVSKTLIEEFEKNDKVYLTKTLDKKTLAPFIKKSALLYHTEALCHVNEKKERFARLISPLTDEELDLKLRGSKNKEKYKTVYSHLSGESETPLKKLFEVYSLDNAGIKFLEKRGVIEVVSRNVERNLYKIPERTENPIEINLSKEQQSAFDTLSTLLDKKEPSAALLYGVTGSGKTSVILKLIDKAIEDNKGVIMLVPEIALTTQSALSLFSRYGNRVAIIHSGMSKGERHDSWEAIKSGKKNIVLGTRSAIFAPVKNLGLVIIDEEQDDSYKSDTNPRYHARDLARFVCAKTSALMLLSSATPDIESFYNAKNGKYKLVTLEKRFGNAVLPDVFVSDVTDSKISSPDRLIGEELEEKLHEVLKRGEQAVLFVNRRGLKKLLICRDCKSAVTCPNCSVSMTLHKEGEGHRLVCHYCGYSMTPPTTCPTCSSEHMQYRGYGTQKLEQELISLFPQAKTVRMDADTTRKKLSHDELIEQFSRHEADFLIGTQMVAKGHNFPDVTLVGVIMADLSLYSSDYRANEHTFALMTQVIGRAGRGDKKGCAVIQTLNPYNEVIELCTTQDYDTFFEGEISLRKALLFPPFCSVGMFLITSDNERDLDTACENLNKFLEEKLKGEFSDVKIIAYGPFDAVPYKLKNTFRRKLVVKYKNNSRTRQLFKEALLNFSSKGKANCSFDPSPNTI
ncbi:MAG: primosomal protein N' [Ruminococcaceae bacterium]|nr:primosomal protein N' [Oscillospiraceae bacterium]